MLKAGCVLGRIPVFPPSISPNKLIHWAPQPELYIMISLTLPVLLISLYLKVLVSHFESRL